MKQTAVEWLFEKVWITPVSELPKILEQAKEMEKQQIIDAFIGQDSDTDENLEIAEQYYNETFNK